MFCINATWIVDIIVISKPSSTLVTNCFLCELIDLASGWHRNFKLIQKSRYYKKNWFDTGALLLLELYKTIVNWFDGAE